MQQEEKQVGPLVGWVICRLKEDREESNEKQKGSSLSHHIVDLTFGSLSRGDFPPTTSWIFLAKEKHLSIVAQYFTDEQIQAACQAQIKVNRFRRKNDAFGAEFTLEDTVRGVVVSGCPIQELNGSYLEHGSHNGVPMYMHVRKWCILRMELPELPELGISAADTIRMEQEGGNTTFFYSKADDSFLRIVDPSSTIREGGSEFTRLYIDIARAGNKMVIEDQTLLKLHNNEMRSTLQDKNSSQLLKTLAAYSIDSQVNYEQTNLEEHIDNLEFSDPPKTQFLNTSMSNEEKKQTTQANNIHARGTTYDDGTLLTEQILSKSITHQQKPSNNVHVLPSDSPHSHDRIRSSDDFVFGAEAELVNEVVAAITAREETVSSLIASAVAANARYLNGEFTETSCFSSLFESFQKVRDTTLAFFNAFAVWQRLVKKRKRHEQYLDLKRSSIAFNNVKDNRSFSVIIAYNSAVDLFGSSEAVKSTVSKKFSRNFESAVKKKELKFVGEFSTREEAIEALEKALQQIPQEQWLQTDVDANSKAIVSFRPCKKHYLVRTSGVDVNIPCELCAAAKTAKKVTKIAGSDTETLAFPWRAVDYTEKLQQDLSVLDDLEVIVKMRRKNQSFGQPILRMTNNPLLLDDSFLEYAGRVLRSSHGHTLISELDKDDTFSNSMSLMSLSGKYRPNITYCAPSGPIQASKGKIELLHDALVFSRTYQQQEKEKTKLQPYLTLPYNKSQAAKQYEAEIKDKKRRSQHQRQRQAAEFIHDDLLSLQMQLASLSIPAPPELLKRVLQTIPLAYDVAKLSAKTTSVNLAHDIQEQNQHFDNPSVDLNSQRPLSTPAIAADTVQNTSSSGALLDDTFGASPDLLASHSASSLYRKDRTFLSINTNDKKSVVAEISQLGATMTMTQERLPPAFREEDKFCRTDVGEWAGMTNGRAVRSFNFQDNLLKEGKEKEKTRKNVQLQLRRAIAPEKSIVNCNVAEIEALIKAARAIRGSVLQLDIINAENYLRRRVELIAWSNHIQSVFRGNKDRKMFREMRTARMEGHKKKVALSQYAGEWSTAIALDLLQQGVKRETKRRLQDRFRCVVNLSGILAVATVVRASRAFRGPIDTLFQTTICPSCASSKTAGKASTRFDAYHLKRAEREEDAALAATGRVPTAKKPSTTTATTKSSTVDNTVCYDSYSGPTTKTAIKSANKVTKALEDEVRDEDDVGHFTNDHSEYRFPSRTVCTCPILEESERWHVRFHFPMSCAEDVREFSIEQIIDVLKQLEEAFDMYRQCFQKQKKLQQQRLQSRRSQAMSARMPLTGLVDNMQPSITDIVKDVVTDTVSEFGTFQKVFRPLLDLQHYNSMDRNDESKLSDNDFEDLTEAADESSWTKAYVRAGQESAAALRLMTAAPLPPSVIAVLQGNKSNFAQQIFLDENQATMSLGHLTLPSFHSLHMSDNTQSTADVLTSKTSWEPFRSRDAALVRFNTVKHQQNQILLAQTDTVFNLKSAEEELVEKLTFREEESMAFEDILARCYRLQEQYEYECRHNAYVMARSKELFESVYAMEKQIKFDDFRSYDNLESGSLWKSMHRKGEIEQELTKLIPLIKEAQVRKVKASKQCIKVTNKLEKCKLDMLQQNTAERKIAEEVASCEADLRQLTLELSMSSKQFARSFSKPRRLRTSYAELLRDRTSRYDETGRISTRDKSLPGDRRLQIVPNNLVLVRDANLRLKQENRKLLSGLCRRILSIFPLEYQKYLFADTIVRSSRCMVSCFIDDLTGTMVIHLSDASLYQKELLGVETAEAIQHEDFQLDSRSFSLLATVTQRYEISLSNEEVKYLVQKYESDFKRKLVHSRSVQDETGSKILHDSAFGVAPMTTSCVTNIAYQEDPLRLTSELAVHSNHKSDVSSLSRSKNNYLQRFERREKAAVETAEILVSLLRLQPFTHRPCLGDLAFHRRLRHTLSIIQQCAWYRDLLSSQPSSVITAQVSQPMFTTIVHLGPQQRVLCKIWQHLDKFELQLVPLECNVFLSCITRIELTALQILQRLQYSTVDVFAWIGMITLNCYDIGSVFDGLISSLVPSLPGMIHWRSKLATEIPVVSFEGLTLRHSSRLTEKTFRRVTSCHRFVSGKFCMAVCEISGEVRASGLHSQNWSVSISLHSPIENKFTNHRYCETDALVVTMTNQELIAFLLQQVQVLVKLHSQTILLGAAHTSTNSASAKKQKRKMLAEATSQVVEAVQRCFSLLHSFSLDNLFNHLLDSVDFPKLTAMTKNKSVNKLLAIPIGALRPLPGDFSDSFLQEHHIDCNVDSDLNDDIMKNAFSSIEEVDEETYLGALHCGLEIDPVALSCFMKRSLDQHIAFIERRFPMRSKTLGLSILKSTLKELEENMQHQADSDLSTVLSNISVSKTSTQENKITKKNVVPDNYVLERRKVVDATAVLNVVSWPSHVMAALTTPVKAEKDLAHALLTIEKSNLALMRESVFMTEHRRRNSITMFEVPNTSIAVPIGDATAIEATASSGTGQQLTLHSTLWKFPLHADLTKGIDESRPRDTDDDDENSLLTRVIIRSTPSLGAIWIDVENAQREEMEPVSAQRELRAMKYEDSRSERLRHYFKTSVVVNIMPIENALNKSDSCTNPLISDFVNSCIMIDATLHTHKQRLNDSRLKTTALYIINTFRSFNSHAFEFSYLDGQSVDSETSGNKKELSVEILPLNMKSSEWFAPHLTRKSYIPVSHRQHRYCEKRSAVSSVVIPSLAFRDHTIWQRSSLGLIDRNIFLREQRHMKYEQNNSWKQDILSCMDNTSRNKSDHIIWQWQQEVRTITHVDSRSLCIRHIHVSLTYENLRDDAHVDLQEREFFVFVTHLQAIDLYSDDSWTIRLTSPLQISCMLSCHSWDNNAETLVLNKAKDEVSRIISSQILFSKVSSALKQILDPPLEVKSVALPVSSNVSDSGRNMYTNILSSESLEAHVGEVIDASVENEFAISDILSDSSAIFTLAQQSLTDKSSGNSANDGSFNCLSVQPTNLNEANSVRFREINTDFDINSIVKAHTKYFYGTQRTTAKKSKPLFCSPHNESNIAPEIEMNSDLPTEEMTQKISILESRKNVRRSAVAASPQKAINDKTTKNMTEDEKKQEEKQKRQELSDLEDLYDIPWQPSYLVPGKKHLSKKCKLVALLLPRELIYEHRLRFINVQVMQKKVFKFLRQLHEREENIIEHGKWEKDMLSGVILYSYENESQTTETQDTSKLSTLARRLLMRQQRRVNERFISIVSRLPGALQEIDPARIEILARRPGVLMLQRNLRSASAREQLLSALEGSLSALAVTQENRRRSSGRERECLLQHQRLLRAVSRKLGELLHDAVQIVYHSALHLPCRVRTKNVDVSRYSLAVKLLQICEESLLAHRAKRTDIHLNHHLTNIRNKFVEMQDENDLEDLMRRELDLDSHLFHISTDSTVLLKEKGVIAPLLLEYPGEEVVDNILEQFTVANSAETELAENEETRSSLELFQILNADDCLHLLEKILMNEANAVLGDALDEEEFSSTANTNDIAVRRLSRKEFSWLRVMLHPLHVLSAVISSHCCGSENSHFIKRSPCSLPLAECQFPGCRSCRVLNRAKSLADYSNSNSVLTSEIMVDTQYRHWQERIVQPWLLSIVDACATSHNIKVHWTSGLLPPSLKLDLQKITHVVEPALTIAREKMLEDFAKKNFLRELNHKIYLRRGYRDTLLTTQCLLALRYILSDVYLFSVSKSQNVKQSSLLASMTLKDNGRTSAATQWLSISSLRTLGGRFGLRMLNHLRLLLKFLYQQSQKSSDIVSTEPLLGSLWLDLRKALTLMFPNKRQRKQLDVVGDIVGLDVDVGSALRRSVTDTGSLVTISPAKTNRVTNLNKETPGVRISLSAVESTLRKTQTFLRASISQQRNVMEDTCRPLSRPVTSHSYIDNLRKNNSFGSNMAPIVSNDYSLVSLQCDSNRLPVEHVQAMLQTDNSKMGTMISSFVESVVYSNVEFSRLLLPLLRLSPKRAKPVTTSGGSEKASLEPFVSTLSSANISDEQTSSAVGKHQDSIGTHSYSDMGLRSPILHLPKVRQKLSRQLWQHNDCEEASVDSDSFPQIRMGVPTKGSNVDCVVAMDRLLYEGSFFYSNFNKSAGLGSISEVVMVAQITFGQFSKDNPNYIDGNDEDERQIPSLSKEERYEINKTAFHIGGEYISDDDLLSGRLQVGSERFISLVDSLRLLDGVTVTIYDAHSHVHSKPMGIDSASLQSFVMRQDIGRRLLRMENQSDKWGFDCYRFAAHLLFLKLPQLLHCTFIHGRCISMSINMQETYDANLHEVCENKVPQNSHSTDSISSQLQLTNRVGKNYTVAMPIRTRRKAWQDLLSRSFAS